MDNDAKQKALAAALTQIEKAYGKGAVMKLGDPAASMNVETVPTGSLSLDLALGLGGVPKGRVVEIYGPESSGKTTVALHMVAEVQKRSTRWIRSMPGTSAWISTIFTSPSRTTASRPWRSRRPWSAAARWIS